MKFKTVKWAAGEAARIEAEQLVKMLPEMAAKMAGVPFIRKIESRTTGQTFERTQWGWI